MRSLCLLLILLLTGCGGGAVVFAPTPLPPDLSPLRYEHPTGAFSISVPRSWSVYIQNTATLASASFSAPDQAEPVMTVAVINTGAPIEAAQSGDLMEQYQTRYRPDVEGYTEQNRQAMGDGSWRLTGYRTTNAGVTQAVNTFFEFSGSLIGIIDVVISRDGTLQAELQTAVNTFRINPQTGLQPAELSTLSLVRRSSLEVQNISAWTNTLGIFFVTGEVANYSDQAVSQVPISVALLAQDGTTMIEAADVVMGYAIAPGGFAPFSLRFGEGQPSEAVNYRVTLGSSNAASPEILYGAGALEWTDDSTFADDGSLLISGTVRNTGDVPVREPLGIVTVFDAQQQVIGAWFSPLGESEILADGSIDFQIRVPEIGGEPVNYILDIQAVADGTPE